VLYIPGVKDLTASFPGAMKWFYKDHKDKKAANAVSLLLESWIVRN